MPKLHLDPSVHMPEIETIGRHHGEGRAGAEGWGHIKIFTPCMDSGRSILTSTDQSAFKHGNAGRDKAELFRPGIDL